MLVYIQNCLFFTIFLEMCTYSERINLFTIFYTLSSYKLNIFALSVKLERKIIILDALI